KILLKNQKLRQETAWSRTGRLITNYGRLDSLTPEQQSEVRQAGLEQNDITSKLDSARKDIRQIQRRGGYNKIYNEAAAEKLQGRARLESSAERTGSFREGQNLQSAVAAGIQKALDYLDKWSSYQEIIRITREIKEHQDQINKDIKKNGGGK